MPANRTAGDQTRFRLHEFDPTTFDWEEWEVLFDTYLEVENISDDIKKRNLLITGLGVQPFKTLISICKPKKPTEWSYRELLTKLRSNYARITFASTERIKFFGKRQEAAQSLTHFANHLRDKATTCNFPPDFYEQALITAFVGGLTNDLVRKHLMQRSLETFEETINAAKIMESVTIEGSQTKSDSSDDLIINKINLRDTQMTKLNTKLTCSSCGSSNHLRSTCRFRNVTCHKCKKDGHIAKVCRSSNSSHKNNVNSIYSSTLGQITCDRPIQIHLLIEHIKVELQVDTGSPVTLINEQVWIEMGRLKLDPCKINLNSFTGHSIQLKGQKVVDVVYNDQSYKLTIFVINGSGINILGRDWLDSLRLNTKTLNDIDSNTSVLSINSEIKILDNLYSKFNDIFKEELGCCKVEAHLHIKPNVIPRFCKPRSLPFAYRQAVENDLNRLIAEGVLEPVSVSKWAAPVVVVPKPGGKVRICADLSTGVNQALDINQYPLPKPNELFVALNGGNQFSKIDFSDAYLQVKLDDESKQLMVINTHKGLFRYNRLPFGVASAPSIFQQIMDQMLAGLNGTVCYLDDIIITGKNMEDHLYNLHQVFERITEYGFRVNKNKCSFLQDQVEYLGFIVDKHGVHTSPSKTKAIVEMPKPNNLSQLRSFLGMVNHYGKFISKLTERLKPFYQLLKKDIPWTWTASCEQAFKSIKQILTSPIGLAHYDPTLPLVLAADASNAGVGAVIYHRYPDGTEKAIAHASKTLTSTEQNYAQIEKEALALIYGTQKFDQFIRGRKFTLLTDHKPLIAIFGPNKGIPVMSANRLQRWAIRLMGYSYDIEYRSTHNFGQADGLSRLPVGPDIQFDNQDPGETQLIALIQQELQKDLPIRASQVAHATRKDPILVQVHHYVLSGWPSVSQISDLLQPYYRIREELSTSYGCILWGLRTIIPSCFRNKLLNHLHSTHAGMGRMKAEARRYFWWPLLDRDIEQSAHQCQACSENSKQPMKVPLQQWNVPQQPWQRIHIDFMGKFMNHYFFVVVDAHSKWLEVIIMRNITTTATINALTTLFARYGLCEEIVSDNGTQFTSDEFAEFCGRHGIRHIRTAPGHPQSNGQAERYVDTVKTALKKGITDGGNLSDVLCKFLFRYRSTTHSTTNSTPAELFLKREFRTVLDLLRPNAVDASNKARTRYQTNFDQHAKARIFNPGDKVLVRDLRKSPNIVKWIAGTLIRRSGSCMWFVTVDNQVWRRHENQIKVRHWSNHEDFMILDQTSTKSDDETSSQNNNSSAGQDTPVLRQSSRVKKPVQRLIEEI
jgi:transposase InsO family protein